MRSFAAVPEFCSTTPLTISLSLGLRLMASGILLLSWVERARGYNPATLTTGLTRPRTGGPKAARRGIVAITGRDGEPPAPTGSRWTATGSPETDGSAA